MSLTSLVEPEGSQLPAHCIDSRYELDGTAHELLVLDAAVKEQVFGALKVGRNDGADLLEAEMSSSIQKYLEDPLAEAIIGSTISEGDVLEVKHTKNSEELTIGTKKPKAAKKK